MWPASLALDNATRPRVVVIGGPNGAGKTTIARGVLPRLGVQTFVNADVIAQGLSMFNSERVASQAGRVMLERLHELAAAGESFAFETTLASRSFAPWLKKLIAGVYDFHLICVWVANPEVSIDRIALRVARGGHHVPNETVRRRYTAGLRNFFHLYQPIATTWLMVDNSEEMQPTLIAHGSGPSVHEVKQHLIWNQLQREHL